MPATLDRLQFAPPPQPGMLRALALAILAHLLLMAALTWGISWNSEPVTLSAEAELWSRVPQEVAPALVEPPTPVPVPVPVPVPPAPPIEAVKPPAPPEPSAVARDAEIALEREQEKERLAAQQRKQLALEKKREQEKERELELAAKKKREAAQELEAKRKQDEARKKQELAKAKSADEKKLEARKEEAAKKLKLTEEAKRIENQRVANLERMKGLAGATGAPTATGAALRSSGPSSSYAGRIVARVKPNIVFGEEIAGNPKAEVEVKTAPDGTIVGQRIVKSSGVASWDEAVLKALIKTQVLPRDTDGRVPPSLFIDFRPKD
jgi:colicin import membrane protein